MYDSFSVFLKTGAIIHKKILTLPKHYVNARQMVCFLLLNNIYKEQICN